MTADAIEGVLQDFRTWLYDAAQHPSGTEEPEFCWQILVAEFTALRQEVNLQTRAARAQMEQNAEATTQVRATVAALEEARQTDEARTDDSLRPLLKTLVDVYDALALARREMARVQTSLESALTSMEPASDFAAEPVRVHGAHPRPARKRPWWRWWSSASAGPEETTTVLLEKIAELEERHARQRERSAQMLRDQDSRLQAAEQVRQFLNSVIAGYTMGLQRLDRALAQHELEVIDCVGEAFDPECMEVVEVVSEPGRSGTEVLEVVRRGYLRNGNVFRNAQVRVARP